MRTDQPSPAKFCIGSLRKIITINCHNFKQQPVGYRELACTVSSPPISEEINVYRTSRAERSRARAASEGISCTELSASQEAIFSAARARGLKSTSSCVVRKLVNFSDAALSFSVSLFIGQFYKVCVSGARGARYPLSVPQG